MVASRQPPKIDVRDILEVFSTTEAHCCSGVVQRLTAEPWARGLVENVGDAKNWSRDLIPFFFELRIAGELAARGLALQYEAPGANKKTVDFRFEHNDLKWLVEVVSLRTSEAVQQAVLHHPNAGVYEVPLASDNRDQRQTHAGELIRLQEAVAAKATKFPAIADGTVHVVIADTRRVGITGVDRPDALQFAVGPAAVGVFANRFKGGPVRGIFEQDSVPTMKGIGEARARVHFVAFSGDTTYGPNTLLNGMRVVHNPLLIRATEEAQALWSRGPWVWTG